MSSTLPIGFSIERNVASASIYLSSPVVGAIIRYTTDGTEPSAENGNTYTGSFELVGTKTVKAIVMKEGLVDSVIARLEITVIVPDIVLEKEDGTAVDNCKVIIVNMDAYETFTGIVFRYTTDGSEPIETSPVVDGEIEVTVNCTVKVKGFSENFGNTDTASIVVDDLMAQTPVIEFVASTDNGLATISSGTSDAEIRYTTNGDNPTENSTLYVDSFAVALGKTVKAIALKDGLLDSEVSEKLIIDPMRNWTAIEDIKFGTTSVRSIAYGDGKYVAVGYSGKASYSEDGINWTAIEDTKAGTKDIDFVSYCNGKFFICISSLNKISYSEDGINWTLSEKIGFYSPSGICYGNGKFVVFSTSNKASYSEDGITWTPIEDTKFGTNYISDMCYGNGKFVAVGRNNSGSYSEDGINWTAIEDMGFYSDRYIDSVDYGNGIFVAVAGGTSDTSYSEDGINWIAGGTSYMTALNDMCYGNGKFVVVGADNVGAYSEDCITWNRINDLNLTKDITPYSICYGDGKFIAGGESGKASYCVVEE